MIIQWWRTKQGLNKGTINKRKKERKKERKKKIKIKIKNKNTKKIEEHSSIGQNSTMVKCSTFSCSFIATDLSFISTQLTTWRENSEIECFCIALVSRTKTINLYEIMGLAQLIFLLIHERYQLRNDLVLFFCSNRESKKLPWLRAKRIPFNMGSLCFLHDYQISRWAIIFNHIEQLTSSPLNWSNLSSWVRHDDISRSYHIFRVCSQSCLSSFTLFLGTHTSCWCENCIVIITDMISNGAALQWFKLWFYAESKRRNCLWCSQIYR